MSRLLIVYYSEKGITEHMAELVGEGAKKQGIDVIIKRVEETKPEELLTYKGIVIGSPTYFSNVSWQIKKFIDDTFILFERDEALKGKVGGCFTSSGTHEDAEDCIKMMEIALGVHHEMELVPGIIAPSWLKEEKVSEITKEYGEKIARKIISKKIETK